MQKIKVKHTSTNSYLVKTRHLRLLNIPKQLQRRHTVVVPTNMHWSAHLYDPFPFIFFFLLKKYANRRDIAFITLKEKDQTR